MASTGPKPLIWFLEEATPEVAQLMHQLERSLQGAATVQRVSYVEALRSLPREAERDALVAVVVFSLPNLQNLAALLKRAASPPRLCFLPPSYEALAAVRPHMRWGVSVSAVARHTGEAMLLHDSGWKPEHVVRLQADVHPDVLVEHVPGEPQPLRVGFAWYNMASMQRETLTREIARWRQSAPNRIVWRIYCLPGDEPVEADLADVERVLVTPERMAAAERDSLDVLLVDPWWPDALPRPYEAAVHLYLPPGGAPGELWQERLQALVDLVAAPGWRDEPVIGFCYQSLWRHLLKGEERPTPVVPVADTGLLAASRRLQQRALSAERRAWAEAEEPPSAEALAYHFLIYDLRVQTSWCLHLWQALSTARNGERHALLLALNALALHHGGSSWLLKRLLARSPVGRAHRSRKFSRRFWLRFASKHLGLMHRLVSAMRTCGRAPDADPLPLFREVSAKLLEAGHVTIERRNEPAPRAGLPTIYLMSHRHAELDPFLLLAVLKGPLAVVVGPRAQRWPLVKRLANSPSFVLTGRERGVVIADAIAALRSKRALALYPEVTEPTYLGEGSPLRSGLTWIVQALEACQVIPVVLNDTFAIGSEGGTVSLWFGEPIVCVGGDCDGLLQRVRWFFHGHVPRMNALDEAEWLERGVPEAAPVAQS